MQARVVREVPSQQVSVLLLWFYSGHWRGEIPLGCPAPCPEVPVPACLGEARPGGLGSRTGSGRKPASLLLSTFIDLN